MTVEEIIREFRGEEGEAASRPEWQAMFWDLCQEAIRLCMELNSNYHTPEEIRQIMGRLTGREVGEGFTLFPPFYTDFGKNIAIGRNVFINSGCHFQDQGGIAIGDGALIGHNVVLATVNTRSNRRSAGATAMRPSASARTSGSARTPPSCPASRWAIGP